MAKWIKNVFMSALCDCKEPVGSLSKFFSQIHVHVPCTHNMTYANNDVDIHNT